jgi:tetratricopeptide (TPR) repeat protein
MDLLHRLQRAVSEFRRRKVFRAAAVYLAAAFVVLQLGDIVAEPLGLPGWTMPLLIVFSVTGFVLTLALAWIYELTPDGVRRTASVEDGAEPGSASSPVDRRRLGVAAVIVLALVGSGLLARSTLGRGGVAEESDAIAIVPFRVAGAGAELAYMREGMVDLLAAVLSDRAALAVVPPRVLLRELGSADDAHAIPPRDVVRRVGATRVITGEVVGRSDNVTLSATLHDVRNGREVRATASGPERELEALVERLAAQLVARGDPLTTERVASLDGVPLAAVRYYLEGVALQRRGRFGESMDPLRQALEIDSTFALAALAFHIAGGWAPARQEEILRVERLAYDNRHRLSERDRLHLEAQIWGYPEVTSPGVRLQRLERALASLPDRNELWYEYGDLVFHEGKAVGVNDWEERSRAAFLRALELVPDDLESNYHLGELAYAAGDAAGLDAVAALMRRAGAETRHMAPVLGMQALLRDDSASWRAFHELPRADLAGALNELRHAVLRDGSGMDSVLAIARRLEAQAVTELEANAPRNAQFWVLISSGRPTAAMEVAGRRVSSTGDVASRMEHLQLVAWVGFAWDGDRDAGRRAVNELRTLIDEQESRSGAPPANPFYVCTVALLDLMEGRTDWIERARSLLERGAAEFAQPFDRQQTRSGPIIIDAAMAHVAGPPQLARARLADLEVFLREGPFGAKRLRSAGNLIAAILHELYDDDANALLAWQRLQDTMAPNMLTTALREEARLLDQLGHRDEANAVYQRYFQLRRNAEPGQRVVDEEIRRRLGERLGERG